MRGLHIKTPMSVTPNFFSPFKIIFLVNFPSAKEGRRLNLQTFPPLGCGGCGGGGGGERRGRERWAP